jgi:hypothetical protein
VQALLQALHKLLLSRRQLWLCLLDVLVNLPNLVPEVLEPLADLWISGNANPLQQFQSPTQPDATIVKQDHQK